MVCLIVKTPAALRTTLPLSLDEILHAKEGGKENFSSLLYSSHGPLLDYCRSPPPPPANIKSTDMFFCILLASGWYIFIETSWPRKPNDTAKLISANVPGSSAGGGKCLSFWYHMYGAHINALRVYVRSGSKDTLLWSKTGTRGDKWLQATLTVNIRTYFQAGFY